MAYTSLTSFMSGLASYGKNFQQYLDGVPSLSLRQGVATDIAQLAAEVGGYSGNSYSNLTSLATQLSQSNEVQNDLNQTSAQLRDDARDDWEALVTDFNALEVEEGYAAGNYAATNTVLTYTLGLKRPNDIGQWSDKLTPSQMSSAATALSALATRATAMTNKLTIFRYNPTLLMDSQYGVEYASVGTGTDMDYGTAEGVLSWTDRIGGKVFNATGSVGYVASLRRLNNRPSVNFLTNGYLEYAGKAITATSGTMFYVFVGMRATTAENNTLYAQTKASATSPYLMHQRRQTTPYPAHVELPLSGSTRVMYPPTAALTTTGSPYLLSFNVTDADLIFCRLNKVSKTINATGVNWFGDTGMSTATSSCIGARKLSNAAGSFFQGYIALIAHYTGLTSTQFTAIENAISSYYGFA